GAQRERSSEGAAAEREPPAAIRNGATPARLCGADYLNCHAALLSNSPIALARSRRGQFADQPVHLVGRVVVDEADPDRVSLVAETLVEVQRVPRVVSPDADPALSESRRDLGRRGALDGDEERRHATLERRQAVDGGAVRQRVEEALAESS